MTDFYHLGRVGPSLFLSTGVMLECRVLLVKDEWTGCHYWSLTSPKAKRPNGNTRFSLMTAVLSPCRPLGLRRASTVGELYQTLFFSPTGIRCVHILSYLIGKHRECDQPLLNSQLFFLIFLPTVAVSQPHLPSPRGAPTVIALTHCQSPVAASVFSKLVLFPNDFNKKIITQTHPWRIMFKTVGLQSHYLCLFCFSFRLQPNTNAATPVMRNPPAEREVCDSSGRWNFVPAPEIDPFSTLWSIGLLARLNTCSEWRGYWYSVSSGDPSQYKPLKSLRAFLTACLCVLPWEWQRRGMIHFHGIPICKWANI